MRALSMLMGLAMAGAGAPAFAGDTACLWNALQPTDQAAVLRQYDAGGTPAVGQALRAIEKALAFFACYDPNSTDATNAAHGALQGYAVALAASATIQAETGITPEKLEAAWALIDRPTRVLLLKDDPNDRESVQAGLALERAAARSGWDAQSAGARGDDQFGLFIDYFLGRTVRDLEEGLF